MNYEIKDIIEFYGNIQYVIIPNSDNKVWIMPCKNMNMAMNLYQPSSIKGKLLKLLLPYSYKLKLVRKFVGIKLVNISIEDVFINKIESILGFRDLEYSFFLGTPSIHQKATIQIYKNNKILGYCKVSNNKEIINLFNKEKDILNYLHDKGVNSIPNCLFSGKLTNTVNVFVQSTVKSCKSKVIHEINKKHIDFLKELEEKTKVYCTYEESDFKQSIERLKLNINIFKDNLEQEVILNAIKIVENVMGNNTEFSVYHNDFTPWNMFFEKDNLFVFDFEYAKKTYPSLIDIFHFFTQTAIFVRKEDASVIYMNFKKQFINGELKDLFSNPSKYYMCYLIDIISLYVSRDKGQFSEDVEHNMKIWIELLNNLNEDLNNR